MTRYANLRTDIDIAACTEYRRTLPEMMAGKFDRRRRGGGRRQWVVEPAEREWCVRRLQHDQMLPLGSLTYRQAAFVIAVLSTVRFIHHIGHTSRFHVARSFMHA